MTDLEALRRAICEKPDDDPLRLVYSDCLEEAGHDSAAIIIRYRVQHDQNLKTTLFLAPGSKLWRSADIANKSDDDGRFYMPGSWMDWIVRSLPIPDYGMSVTCRRGLVATVDCPLETWFELGDKIVETHPVEQVRITDKEPRRTLDQTSVLWHPVGCHYHGEDSSSLPDWFCDEVGWRTVFPFEQMMLKRFTSSVEAKAVLGHNALMLARRMAKLPLWGLDGGGT